MFRSEEGEEEGAEEEEEEEEEERAKKNKHKQKNEQTEIMQRHRIMSMYESVMNFLIQACGRLHKCGVDFLGVLITRSRLVGSI